MKRRDFIKCSGLAVCSRYFIVNSSVSFAKPRKELLTGFIVSDAHFGWRNDSNDFVGQRQPEVEEQRKAVRHILETFPDIDLMIDTGDAYHGNLRGEERQKSAGDWTDVISGETGSKPFMYVPGNHEIMGWSQGDPEWRCNILGSLPCRPYYSYDLKGIHFVSVPELMMAVYVNKETIEWLKLDLALNKDKTVVLLSHNNISGTTTPDEEGYRGLVNSKELLDIILAHPNIIAWMHGHNHNFEIVKKHDRLFVSNGRIGGFDPSNGKHGIGGIYFEISDSHMEVKSYSAQFERMLTSSDGPALSGIVKSRTSLDTSAPMAYSYGTGGARDTERIPVINHYTSTSENGRLVITGADDEIINEDTSLSYYQCRPGNKHMQLFGFIVRDPKKHWKWNNPGVTLLKRDDGKDIRLTVPHYGVGKCSYYRCPPGQKYKISLEMETLSEGPTLDLELMYFDRESNLLSSKHMPLYNLPKGRHKKVFEAIVPNPNKANTIYDDPNETNTLNFVAQCIFRDMSQDVIVHKFELSFADANGPTLDPAVKYRGKWYRHSGTLEPDKKSGFDIPMPKKDEMFEIKAEGNRRMSWLVRYDNLDWQFRNAAVADKGIYLEVSGLRNNWTHEKEVVISPLFNSDEPFLSRTKGVLEFRLYPLNRGNKKIKVEIGKCIGNKGRLYFYSNDRISNIKGVIQSKSIGKYVEVDVAPGSVVEVS